MKIPVIHWNLFRRENTEFLALKVIQLFSATNGFDIHEVDLLRLP